MTIANEFTMEETQDSRVVLLMMITNRTWSMRAKESEIALKTLRMRLSVPLKGKTEVQ